jgi:hypothetical protein
MVGRRREGGERRAGPTVWAAGRRGLSGVGAGNQAGRAAWAGRDRAILLDTTAVQWWRGSPRTTRARERGEEAKRASGRRRHQRGAAGAAASNNGGSKQRRVGSCGCGPGPRWHARAGKVRTEQQQANGRDGWAGLGCCVLCCAVRGQALVGVGGRVEGSGSSELAAGRSRAAAALHEREKLDALPVESEATVCVGASCRRRT